MSAYAQCPHCGHPTVTPRSDYGVPQLCRQCGEQFVVVVPPAGAGRNETAYEIDTPAGLRDNPAHAAGV